MEERKIIIEISDIEYLRDKFESQKELNQNLLKRIGVLENEIKFLKNAIDSNFNEIHERFRNHINDFDVHKV